MRGVSRSGPPGCHLPLNQDGTSVCKNKELPRVRRGAGERPGSLLAPGAAPPVRVTLLAAATTRVEDRLLSAGPEQLGEAGRPGSLPLPFLSQAGCVLPTGGPLLSLERSERRSCCHV